MDMKLPSSTQQRAFWKEHEEFLKIAKKKEVFIKAVITSQTKTKAVTVASAKAPTNRGARPIIHKVRSGETLYSISRKYNVLVRQLAEWNLMRPGDVLKLGQRLKVWPATSSAVKLKTAASESEG